MEATSTRATSTGAEDCGARAENRARAHASSDVSDVLPNKEHCRSFEVRNHEIVVVFLDEEVLERAHNIYTDTCYEWTFARILDLQHDLEQGGAVESSSRPYLCFPPNGDVEIHIEGKKVLRGSTFVRELFKAFVELAAERQQDIPPAEAPNTAGRCPF